ncbi:hypothetical protein P3T40_003449 [Paraburkholderia sp. EB58]|uniref:zinc-finger-containing protein n=1 Tax=Paraburkholderia sp. EB58 TaxID=3035125 RepID=UPI003D1E5F83
MRVVCPYCDRDAVLVKGTVIYPHRQDLYARNFWHCASCDAYVGTHRRNRKLKLNGDEPLGRLANRELRKAKVATHAAFDPLWVSGAMTRQAAYEWLAGAIGVSSDNCHIGMFDLDACRAVVAAVELRSKAS